MSFHCPACGGEVATRVLADSVTLIVVGHCAEHGVAEVSRVYIGETAPAYPREPALPAREPALPVREPAPTSAYKPGACCGRRIGEHQWCQLPVDHDEPHAA